MKRTMKEEKSYLIISILIMMLLILGIQNAYPKKIKPKAELVTGALSFNERVACQKAVEKVYYSHRTWNNLTREYQFEQIMPDDVRIEKVKDFIRKSNALESFWKKPITAYQLQAEIDRMVGHTKNPEVLKELFNALSNDPHLIAECIARPNLADQFIRNYYGYDKKFHEEIKKRAEKDLVKNTPVTQIKAMSGEYSEIEWNKSDGMKETSKGNSFALNEAEWKILLNGINSEQLEINRISKLIEDDNKFYVQAVLEKSANRIRISRVIWHKKEFDFWWRDMKKSLSFQITEPESHYKIPEIKPADTIHPAFSCYKERIQSTSVWTNFGYETLIWGGLVDIGLRDEGEKYNPATDTWTCMSIINAPSGRIGHSAIWAERSPNIAVMIIWGGRSAQNEYENTGAWYDPVRDTWKKMRTAGTPIPRRKHTAVWTNTQMIIWGGEVACANSPWCDLVATGSGGIYDPELENNEHVSAWKLTPISPYAAPRSGHAAVWTGSEMIIWGGHGCMDPPNCEWQEECLITGARLNIGSNTWIKMNTDNAPHNAKNFSAVWSAATGKMIICSGQDIAAPYRTRAIYDPGKDSWDSNPPRSNLCP